MKTRHDITKIEVVPTNALVSSKKGFGPIILILAAGMIGVLAFGAFKYFTADNSDDPQPELRVITPAGEKTVEPSVTPEVKNALSCDGIASVAALYNDINAYKIGTDPNNTLTIYEKIGDDNFVMKTVADDATSTTVDVLSRYKALAGNNAGTPLSSYFAEEIEFSTVCSNVDIQPRLKPASAPTITIMNRNGATVNSDSNHETMDASTSYTAKAIVISAAEACSSRYGAIVAFEYDATYASQITSSDLASTNSAFFVDHTTNHSGTGLDMDQYKLMKYSGELCDGKDISFKFTVKTTASTPGEDQANVKVHWFPINKDLDADNFDLLTGIYDEDNNVISQGNTTATYYTA